MASSPTGDIRRDNLDERPLKRARVTDQNQENVAGSSTAEVQGELEENDEEDNREQPSEPSRASDLYLDTVRVY